jgi:hypothetical protein
MFLDFFEFCNFKIVPFLFTLLDLVSNSLVLKLDFFLFRLQFQVKLLLVLFDLLVRLSLNVFRFLFFFARKFLFKVSQLLVRLIFSLLSESFLFRLPLQVPLLLLSLDLILILRNQLLLSKLKIAVDFLQTLFEFLLQQNSVFFDFLFCFSPNQGIFLFIEEIGLQTWIFLCFSIHHHLLKVVIHRVVIDNLPCHCVAVVNLLSLIAVNFPRLRYRLFKLNADYLGFIWWLTPYSAM